MSDITITYYGHSCFKIAYENDSAVLDPYDADSVPGIQLPSGLAAHSVFCSHEHADHNAAHLVNKEDGEDKIKVHSITVPHDDCGGKLRGMNEIHILQCGSCTIVHFGDIGRMLTEEETAELKDADVVMIPVGGHYTIDASQAKDILSAITPKLAVLMHYRKGERGYDVIADIADVKQNIPGVRELEETAVVFAENDVPSGIITLEPEQ